MQLWADVYDPTGTTRLGAGPIALVAASVTRALDGGGSISMTLPGTDITALGLMTNKRRVRIYAELDDTIRELGRGVIETLRTGDIADAFTVTGPDELTYLKQKNTGLARTYSAVSVASAISSLATLAGWTATGTAATLISARFDGESVLKAIQRLTEQQGIHFRGGTSAATIEFGTFGSDSGLRAVYVEGGVERELASNANVVLIENFSLASESKDIYNWVLPLGAGEGEAALTLEKSTRTTPYTIQTGTRPDGKTFWYIADATSIAAYGQIEKIGVFKNIAPLTNTDADITNAANALYDAAVAYIQRYKDRLDTYTLTVRKVATTVRPGDKIHVRYKGIVYRDGVAYTWRDINADFWILECTERLGVDGAALDLKIASIDRQEMDTATVIIGALDAIEIKNLRIATYPTLSAYVFARDVAPSFPAKIPVRVSDATFKLNRCQIRLKTSSFRSNVTGGAAGGDHSHRMFQYNSGIPSGGKTAKFYVGRNSGGGAFLDFEFQSFQAQDIWTYDASGTHTHPAQYGIYDDSATPSTISVYVDGIDRTTALGGTWAPSGGAITIDLDPALMTGYLNNAAGGLRQEHTVEVRCTGGQGRIEAIVELYEVIQAISV